MVRLPDIPICVLAGGTSRRFGSNKALALLSGQTMITHILARLQPQTTASIAINANHTEPFATLDYPVIRDSQWEGQGPLAGIYTALTWAAKEGAGAVITLAVDLPFVPHDLVARFAAAQGPSIASSQGQAHPVNAIWHVSHLPLLDAYLASGKRSAFGWAKTCEASTTTFDQEPGGIDPFWNVNTPEDLAMAQSMLERDKTGSTNF